MGDVIHLRPLTHANRDAVLSLRVSPGQEQFVSSVEESLVEAAEEPGAHGIFWAVYDGETPVGFVMWSDEVDGPGYIAHYLWKLLIDERHQGHAYGRATLDLIVAYFRERGVAVLTTSAGQGDGSPIPFYERYGFVQTGEIVFDNEVLLELRLR
jgi:diamine N-acetyltransferase